MRHAQVVTVLLLGLLQLPAFAVEPAPPEVEVVVRLYKAFAWEAMIEKPLNAGLGFEDQPRPVLERYLESSLARLLASDRECTRRTRDVCRINFKVLWASQDPGAHTLRVEQTTEKGIVRVRFTVPGNVEEAELRYEVAPTKHGMKIRDIHYTAAWSLRATLEQAP